MEGVEQVGVEQDSGGRQLATGAARIKPDDTVQPYPFATGAELCAHASRTGLAISDLMLENEKALRSEAQVRAGLLRIWEVMQACVKRGCEREGILPGGLKVKRRAAASSSAAKAW